MPCMMELIKADAPEAELTKAQFSELLATGSVKADAKPYVTKSRSYLEAVFKRCIEPQGSAKREAAGTSTVSAESNAVSEREGSAATEAALLDSPDASEYQFPLMDGHDHVVVAGYSPFTDSQRFHRESRFPRRLLTWRRPLFLACKHMPGFKTLSLINQARGTVSNAIAII